MMTLQAFRDLLLTLGVPVHHYEPEQQTDKYIVWHEYGTGGCHGDNVRAVRVRSVQVDLFTREEFDPLADALEALLTDSQIPFDGPQTDFEDDTGYIHIWWDCEVPDVPAR